MDLEGRYSTGNRQCFVVPQPGRLFTSFPYPAQPKQKKKEKEKQPFPGFGSCGGGANFISWVLPPRDRKHNEQDG